MSVPIKKDEIVEEGVLDNLLKPLIQVQEELRKTDAEITKFGDTVKNLNFSEKAKDLREFAAAEEQINRVYNEKKDIVKSTIEVENAYTKAKKEVQQLSKGFQRDLDFENKAIKDMNGTISQNAKQIQELTARKSALDKQIKTVKTSFDNGKISAEEYAQRTAGLVVEQTNLKVAMGEARVALNAQIKMEQASAGSMDAMKQRLGQMRDAYRKLSDEERNNTAIGGDLLNSIKVLESEWSGLQKTTGNFQHQVGNYAAAFDELTARVENGGLTMRQLTKAIKEYETIAINAGDADPIGREALVRAGQLKDEVGDIRAITTALSTDTVNLDAAINTVEGLGGAYQAVEGAMVLVGNENEDMMRAMAKLTAIQSIMNGLKSFEAMINKNNIALLKQTTLYIKAETAVKAANTFVTAGATVATQALRAAMIALPIMAIIALIAALVVKFSSWNDGSKEATERQKRLAEETKKQNKQIVEQSREFVGLLYQLKATNKGSEERSKLMKEINAEYGLTLTNLSDEQAFQQSVNAYIAEYIVLQREKLKLQRNEGKFTFALTQQQTLLDRRAKVESEILKIEKERNSASLKFTRDQERRRLTGLGVNELDIQRATGEEAEIKRLDRLRAEQSRLNKEIEQYEMGLGSTARTILDIRAEIDKMTLGGKRLERQTISNTTATDKEAKAVEDLTGKYKKLQTEREKLSKKEQAELEAKERQELLDKQIESEINALDELDKKREIQNIQEAQSQEEMNKWEKQREIQKLEELLAIQEKYGQDTLDTRLALAKARQDLDKKEAESLSESYGVIAKSFEDVYTKAADKAIEAMQRQEQAAANMYSVFAQLAAEGNITAQQSLAEMINRQEELQRRQEQMERRKLRMQRATQASSILVNELDKGKSVPEALAAMGAFLAASESLIPSFFEGTENTGKGGKIDGKGGFAAILHPNERVLTAAQNSKIGDIPNPVVADVMYKFKTGQLDMGKNSYDLIRLESKLDSIRQAIEKQPQQIVGLEETLSGMVKLATSQVKGNHKTTNRFHS